MTTHAEMLRNALVEIEPLLVSHGFKLAETREGSGSGGPCAVAAYKRGLWRVYLYYRDGSLEPGWYRHAWTEATHIALQPPELRTGLSLNPDEYARQIEAHAGCVLKGDWRTFRRIARKANRESQRALLG